MPAIRRTATERLLGFNQQMLDQALAVVGAYLVQHAPPFAGPVGAHLRHVVEHYEALIQGLQTGVVDYDGRLRDRQLETRPELARERLASVRKTLDSWTPDMLIHSVQVLGQGGTVGDFDFSVASSVGRELAFLASHAVHHFALMVPHLQRHGIPMPTHFGKAPGTVANEIAMPRAKPPTDTQESSCLSPSLPG